MLENHKHPIRMALYIHGLAMYLPLSRSEQMQRRTPEKELVDFCRRNAVSLYDLFFVYRTSQNELDVG
jgi:hypothetical protein